MSSPLLQLLGSYDLFGKSVPGGALLAGFWILFPSPLLTATNTSGYNLVDIAALLVIFLLIGLMIGQGLHTLADNIGKIFRWFVVRIDEVRRTLQLKGWNVNLDRFETVTDPATLSGVQKLVPGWRNGTVKWTRRRFWGGFDSFAGHRCLFSKWIQWNYSPSGRDRFDDRWELNDRDYLLEPFAKTVEEEFGINIRQSEPEKIELIYPRITSELSNRNIRGYRQFQAIYSFCRSMWMVSFILTIVYAHTLYQPFGSLGILSETPVVINLMPGTTELLLPLLTAINAIIFMDEDGAYKRHFIEYMIASFANKDVESGKYNQIRVDEF